MDKRKSRGEEGVEENCTAELEEKVKQPSLQDHGASSSQRLRSGKVQSAHNGQKEERRGVKGFSMEVSVASTGDSEPGPKRLCHCGDLGRLGTVREAGQDCGRHQYK